MFCHTKLVKRFLKPSFGLVISSFPYKNLNSHLKSNDGMLLLTSADILRCSEAIFISAENFEAF